jgi:hypothetical protein
MGNDAVSAVAAQLQHPIDTRIAHVRDGDYVFRRWFEANFGEQPATLLKARERTSEWRTIISWMRRDQCST